jgi:hypothetical protein
MKKSSLILAGALLLGGISFASPVVKQDAKAPVAKQKAKPGTKTTKTKPATTKTAPAKEMKAAHPKTDAPVKNTAK